VILVGVGTPVIALPISAAAHREIDILGGFRFASTCPPGIALLGSGKLARLEELVKHTYHGLGGAEEGFGMVRRATGDDGRPVAKADGAVRARLLESGVRGWGGRWLGS